MSRKIFEHSTESGNFGIAITVPSDLDYWTVNGKRKNFYFSKMTHENHPEYTGYSLIIWILSIKFAWRNHE